MRNLQAVDTSLKTNYNDVIRYRKYFGTQGNGTSTIPATTFFLFKQGEGETDQNISTNSNVTLKQCDTSLFGQNGIIPNAESFTISHIAVDLRVANVQATTEFTDNSITSVNITPVSVVNPYPLFNYIRTQAVFELWRNSTELLEQGNVEDYPSGLFVDGFSSSAAVVPAITQGTAAGLQNTYTPSGLTMLQNGNRWRELAAWQMLAALDQFYGKLTFCREIALSSTLLCGHIDVLLRGYAQVNRTSKQMFGY